MKVRVAIVAVSVLGVVLLMGAGGTPGPSGVASINVVAPLAKTGTLTPTLRISPGAAGQVLTTQPDGGIGWAEGGGGGSWSPPDGGVLDFGHTIIRAQNFAATDMLDCEVMENCDPDTGSGCPACDCDTQRGSFKTVDVTTCTEHQGIHVDGIAFCMGVRAYSTLGCRWKWQL